MESTIEQDEIIESAAPQPVPSTFEEYAAQRERPAEETKAAEPTEPTTSENQETTDGSEKAGKPKRDRTAEGRIAELTAKHKAEREALEKKVAELEQRGTTANQPKPSDAPKTEVKPEASTGKPLLKDFVAQLKGDETYEDAQERWEDAKTEWRAKQAAENTVKRQAEEAQIKSSERVMGKIEEARAKYEDFDSVTTANWIPPSMLGSLHNYLADDGDPAVLYHLATNADDRNRIASLSPYRQAVELGKIEDRLSKPEPKTPTAPPASKAPAPIRSVGGAGAEPESDPLKAKTFEEYARMREKKK